MAVKCFFDWSYIRFRVLRVGNKSHGHLTCYGVVVVLIPISLFIYVMFMGRDIFYLLRFYLM